MPVLNPTFELPGPSPGLALHWVLRSRASRHAIAAFDGRGREGFEAWVPWFDELLDDVTSRAFFGSSGADTFDVGWLVYRFVDALTDAMVERLRFDLGASGAEGFGWTTFVASWELLSGSSPFVDGLTSGWPASTTFATSFELLPRAPYAFAGGAPRETFDGTWPLLTRS